MKIKSLFLALVSIIIGLGAAFASTQFVALETAYVRAKFSVFGAWHCLATNAACNHVPNAPACNLRIVTLTAPFGEILPAYRAGCTEILRRENQGFDDYFDAIIPDEPTPYDVE